MLEPLLGCPAPAKLNLFLHVTGRRPDGYHTLQSAFRLIDRCDTLDFVPRRDGVIRRVNDVPGVPADIDLVVRAAKLLQQKTGTSYGADITLHKILPMGGGIGGGSSDAATTLLALNKLWQTGVKRATLQEWAIELGADVPFFIFGQAAMAEGIGEKLQTLALPEAHYVVIEPGVSVPTVEIFRSKELTRNSPLLIMAISAMHNALQIFEKQARNDLQPVACKLYPEVQSALDALSEFGTARMSGSGSCVFVELPSPEKAQQALDELSPKWKIWCASSRARHPLYGWAAD